MNATARANRRAAEALVDELGRAGVRDACLSPGSRSTPIVLALARQRRIRTWTVTDERASAFFALGMARTVGRPVAIVCTSGTAAANLLPACVEASLSRVPLLMLTADRPDELRECGAPQTIRQVGLLSSHARWSLDLATPDAGAELETYYRTVACRAYATTLTPQPGPVHLNLPFREPLMDPAEHDGEVGLAHGRSSERPWTVVRPACDRLAEGVAAQLAARLVATPRGLLVCGPNAFARDDAGVAVALAARLGWPILADPLSGLRYGVHDKQAVIDCSDVLLRSESFVARHRPDLIVRLGDLPVSKPLVQFLTYVSCDQILVAPPESWPDPTFRVSEVLRVGTGAFCRDVLGALDSARPTAAGSEASSSTAESRTPARGPALSTAWLSDWQRGARVVAAAITRELGADPPSISDQTLYEGRVAAELLASLPDGSTLVVGNSMPVRDLDTFGRCGDRELRVIGNRGANGIDGVLATALGVAVAADGPVALLIGDLSFLHDVGALQIAARHGIDLVVVVVNNDGGGVFHHLPPAALGQTFEDLFATPHGLPFEPLVRACHGAYACVRSWPTLSAAVDRALIRGGLTVLEVPTDRVQAAERRRAIIACATTALANLPGVGEAAA